MKNNRYTLRALARLLAYPDADLRAQLDPLMAAIDAEAALSPSRRAELRALAADLLRRDPIEVESRYVETFDRGRSTSLHLFEHVHGDSRDRGPAMIDLRQTYERAGLDLASGELPDHLGVVLEFASTQSASVAKGFLAELGHIVNAIFSALMQKKSPYAAVMAAVLDLAGMPARAVEIEPEETLDESWAEPVAFDGCSTRGQARPGDPQPVHLVRKASTQGVMA
jgi:nitrate reductase delta subunit